MPAICRTIADEIVPILEETILQIHCDECLDKLFAHFLQDLGMREIIIQRLQHKVLFEWEFGVNRNPIPAPISSYRRLSDDLEAILRVVGKYYGRYDLLHGDLDALHKQKWYLQKLVNFKKLPRRDANHVALEQVSRWQESQCWDVTSGIKKLEPHLVIPSIGWVSTHMRRVHKKEEWWILAELDR